LSKYFINLFLQNSRQQSSPISMVDFGWIT